jgi:hypothetical protein
MKYLKIRNWEEWQTYRKDRGTPPWVKVHRNLMTNHEWMMMSDEEKGQLISLWLIAADKGGKIPADKNILKKMACLDKAPDIEKFIKLQWIEHDGVTVTTKRQPNDAPETETETETETELKEKNIKKRKAKFKRPENVDYQIWNDFCEMRKVKKAPITKTVISRIENEALKINWDLQKAIEYMVLRNWQGFNHKWILNEQQKDKTHGKQSKLDQAKQSAVEWLDGR